MRIALGCLIVFLGFISGLVLFAPANKVFGLVQNAIPNNVEVVSPQGRLLSGKAESLAINNQVMLQPVFWQLDPLGLLLGRGSLRFNGELLGLRRAHGKVNASLLGTGKVRFQDLHLSCGISDCMKLTKLRFSPVNGEVLLDIDTAQLDIADPRPQLKQLQGTVRLRNMQWTLLKPALDLGEFVADLSTDDAGVLRGAIRDQDATVKAQGNVSLDPQGQYNLELSVQPTPDTPAMITNGIKTMGRPNSQGQYQLSYKGRVPGW
nr:type II secretion system protein N [Oceanococcus sp. HetDA_MAG_MS8]